MPDRARRIVVLAHCHLNVNTKVHGLACYSGARTDVVVPLIEDGIGIVQLPCPEATFLGMKRWGMTVEQYDTAAYRRHCRGILAPVIATLVALVEDGCAIEAILGVDGSPSCGVTETCAGYEGGEIEDLLGGGHAPSAHRAAGRGIFMQEFEAAVHEAGIGPFPTSGITESC